MAIFTTSQTNGFSFGVDGITNIVAAGVTISDTANDAVRSVNDDSHLVNYGSLLSNAPADFGVEFTSAATNSSIFNGTTGVISGITGVGSTETMSVSSTTGASTASAPACFSVRTPTAPTFSITATSTAAQAPVLPPIQILMAH